MSRLLRAAAAATTVTAEQSNDIFTQTPRSVELFDLSLIGDSSETQHRVGLNMAKVKEYAQEMKESPDTFGGFPAIWLVEDRATFRYWVARGHHRIAAAKQAGLATFPAKVYTGTRRDAVLLGAGSNADHGYKRSRDDLQHELDMFLLDDEWVKWSDGYICKLVKCSRKTVTNRREELVRQGLISETGERIYRDKHGHINVMQTGGIQQANAARARVPLTEKEIEAVILTELGRRVTSGRLADKIDWLRKHRTFTHYTAIVNEGKTSTDEAFAAVADRMIAKLENELKELHARNEQQAANLGKLGRFVSPNPPATEPASEQAATQQAKAFSPTLFWSHMRTLAEHLDSAAPLLREMLAHLPADLKTSVNADDVDRLIDLATVARLCAERAKQGKIA